MKKFTFRLEALLKTRKIEEDQAKKKLAEEEKTLLEEKNKLAVLEQESLEVEKEMQGAVHQNSSFFLQNSLNYLSLMKEKIVLQQDILLKQENKKELAKKLLIDRRQEREMIEKLKEKKHTEWSKELLKEEQEFLDEMATMRHRAKEDSL